MIMDSNPFATRTEPPPLCHPSHDHCFACGRLHPHGLGLRFTADAIGGVCAIWQPTATHQSYPGRLHGGITSTLLDCAMVHALFLQSITGVTAEIQIRYYQAVNLNDPLRIVGRVVSHRHSLYFCEAEVFQQSVLAARAMAKFMAT
jgi:acyl-coenzyme A thioesterase PaaI-like protein